MMVIIYNYLCRIINYSVMYKTQHNDGKEVDWDVRKRGRDRDKERVEVERRREGGY